MADPKGIEFHEVPIPTRRRPETAKVPPPATTSTCPNCLQTFTQPNPQVVYCSLQCKSEAGTVRYGRRKYEEYDDQLPEDIQYALSMQIAHTLSGGYDSKARHLSRAIREVVWDRDQGRCVQCGEPGKEIDHIDGPSADLSNLQLLCLDCHHAKTDQSLVPIAEDDHGTRALALDLRIRMVSPRPVRPSDDPDWKSAPWLAAHRRPAIG